MHPRPIPSFSLIHPFPNLFHTTRYKPTSSTIQTFPLFVLVVFVLVGMVLAAFRFMISLYATSTSLLLMSKSGANSRWVGSVLKTRGRTVKPLGSGAPNVCLAMTFRAWWGRCLAPCLEAETVERMERKRSAEAMVESMEGIFSKWQCYSSVTDDVGSITSSNSSNGMATYICIMVSDKDRLDGGLTKWLTDVILGRTWTKNFINIARSRYIYSLCKTRSQAPHLYFLD